MNGAKSLKAVLIVYVVLFGSAFGLLFCHLDNHLLWGDEAETACLARNVVQYGIPQTFDGTNYILLHGTVDETPSHVWIWSPWMQDYLAASSFIVFGETTRAARAPFALIGWGSVLLLGLIAFRIYKNHGVTIGAVALLATSEVFLLHARQCRYYPISVFAEILFAYGAYETLERRPRGAWVASLALVIQFYSNYIIVAANMPAILLLAWMVRKQGRAALIRVAAIPGILLLAALPWLLYAHPWGQGNDLSHQGIGGKALQYLANIHFTFVPLCVVLLPLFGWFLRAGKADDRTAATRQWEHFLLLSMPLYFLVILLAPGCYDRYQLPLLPLMCLLTAVWLFRFVKWPALAAGILLVQVCCNFFPLISAFPLRNGRTLRFPLFEYVSGLATPYTDRFADVLTFFKAHAHPGQTVMSYDPEFPLEFYARLVVINGLFMAPAPGHPPDWYLPVPAAGVVTQPAMPLPKALKPDYTPIFLPVHNSFLSDSYPQPGYYQYHTTPSRGLYLIYELNSLTNEAAAK